MAKKFILLSLVIASIVCLLIYSNILVYDNNRGMKSQILTNFEILHSGKIYFVKKYLFLIKLNSLMMYFMATEIQTDHSDVGICKIPKINPFEESALRIIAADEAGKKLPECLNLNEINQVQFRVDDPSSSLIQLNPNASYWDTWSCCYVGFEQVEMVFSDYFPKDETKKGAFAIDEPLSE